MNKYRALRLLGLDPVAAAIVALLSCAFQPEDQITVLNVRIDLGAKS